MTRAIEAGYNVQKLDGGIWAVTLHGEIQTWRTTRRAAVEEMFFQFNAAQV